MSLISFFNKTNLNKTLMNTIEAIDGTFIHQFFENLINSSLADKMKNPRSYFFLAFQTQLVVLHLCVRNSFYYFYFAIPSFDF